jgi:hypothetical protein
MSPWYKERWPWILMAGPATVVVAGAFTTWLAVASADGLVADDYYKRGLGINAVLKRERAAVDRGIDASIERAPGELRVRLRGATPPALFVHLAHATRAGNDLRLRLEPAGGGLYAAPLPPLAPGAWHAVVDDPRGEWRVVHDLPRDPQRGGA